MYSFSFLKIYLHGRKTERFDASRVTLRAACGAREKEQCGKEKQTNVLKGKMMKTLMMKWSCHGESDEKIKSKGK